MSASLREQDQFESASIECLAIFQGLQLCLHLRNNNSLQIELKCQVIVQAVRRLEEPFAMLENIIHDIRMLMTRFRHCEI